MCDILLDNRPRRSVTLRTAAFFTALLVAPIVATLAIITLSPVIAVVHPYGPAFVFVAFFSPFAGFKTYLIFGAPVFALLALVCHGGLVAGALAGALAITIASHVVGDTGTIEAGMIFAPIWGATFGFLYRRLVLS